MTGNTGDLELVFDAFDAVEESEVRELIADLEASGAHAEIAETHPPPKGVLDVVAVVALIAIGTASAASLAITAAFIYKVFRRGVILDLTGPKPRVRKNDALPRGTLLILKKDGTTEVHEGVEGSAVGELMKLAIAQRG